MDGTTSRGTGVTVDAHDIDQLERLATRAWPAPTCIPVDGWLVRFGEGVTRRANSVLARGYQLMAILRGAHGALTHAMLHTDGKVASVGRGSVEDGWLGVFAMATRPDRRRRGYGAAVLGALTDWAAKQGATKAYLQVDARNHAAQELYRASGFSEAYRYHYRTRPCDR